MKNNNSSPFFHDLAQENLYLKSEIARCHSLLHELEASYFHQKNVRLKDENDTLQSQLLQLTSELEKLNRKDKNAENYKETMEKAKHSLLEKIVTLHDLLQNETFNRKKDIDEKHQLHLKNIKLLEEKQYLQRFIENNEVLYVEEKSARKAGEKQINELKQLNHSLVTQIREKALHLKYISKEVELLGMQMSDTKKRVVELEKSKESIFYETLLAYKRQLDESDAWISSHFADIESRPVQESSEMKKEQEQTIDSSSQIEHLLKDVSEKITELKLRVNLVENESEKMNGKIEEWKEEADSRLSKKFIYKIEKKKNPTDKH
ncbi:sporulation protein [Bacillus gobiensis]|uniref:sporulation protein n=1 Tax=Bacillus gobiensis TaxID=1441095 RepID=UPI003D19BF58